MGTSRQNFLRAFCHLGLLSLAVGVTVARAQYAPVTAQVEVVRRSAAKQSGGARDNSNVVIWLTPLEDLSDPLVLARSTPNQQTLQIVQHNKNFEPHVLVAPIGSIIRFPNKDPFFHNVFSLFDGKRFDLGLYEGGSSNSARFDRPGVSFLFCNIHPEMSAAIVVVDTPYFALSDRAGRVSIPNVPNGRYRMHVWYERSSAEDLRSLEREIVVSASARSVEAFQVADSGDFKLAHKNKYGQDYTPVTSPAYKRP